jgi:hypothetical protein
LIEAYKIFPENLMGGLGIYWRMWQDNMIMDLKESDVEGAEWIQIAQDAIPRLGLL